jgi:hypothetical protein
MFENFRRSLGKAGMCWSQPARVDYMCKNLWARRRKFFLQRRSLGYLHRASDRLPVATTRNLPDYGSFPATPFFCNFWIFFYFSFWCHKDVWGWAWHFGRMGVQHSHFLNLTPILGKVKSSVPHRTWRFHFFPIFFY